MPLINLKSNLSWYGRPPGEPQSSNRVTQAARDAARITKYLTRADGLLFVATQTGLQVTNPNTENARGIADAKSPTKLFNPLSIAGSVSGQVTGVRLARHFSTDPNAPTKYEGILNSRQGLEATTNNRLVRLRTELIGTTNLDPTIYTLTAATGPGGLRTVFTRTTNTTNAVNKFLFELPYQNTRDQTGTYSTALVDDGLSSTKTKFNNIQKYSQQTWKAYYTNTLSLNTDALRAATNSTVNITTENYQANKNITAVDETSVVKNQINDPEFETRILKAPIGTPERYRTLTYGTIKQRRQNRSTSAPAIDYIDGVQWLSKAPTELKQIADGRLISLSIGSISFKAYIQSLTDSIDAQWDGKRDQGRADNIFFYGGFERNVSLSFIVAVETKAEATTEWEKLAALGRLCYPKYSSNGYYSSPVRVTVGAIHKNTPMLLTNVSYDWDTETPWSLITTYDENYQGNDKPLYTSVSCDFIYLGTPKQTQSSVYFG
jgi:hypothetical protein